MGLRITNLLFTNPELTHSIFLLYFFLLVFLDCSILLDELSLVFAFYQYDLNSISTAISATDCSNIAGGMSPCYLKRSKLDTNGNITECSGNMKKQRFSSYGVAIPAVPLRSTPSEKGKWDPQKLVRSHRKDDGFQTNLANIRKTECSREHDSKKLAARESFSLVDGKNSTCKDIQAVGKENGFGMGTRGRVLSSTELNRLLIYRKGDGAKGSNGKYWKMVGEEPNFVDSKAKYFENHGRLIGRNEQAQRFKVLESLKVFEKEYVKLVKERESDVRRGKITKRMLPHVEAAARVKKMGMSVSVEMGFGHIPGIEIGDKFRFRVELAMVGLHRLLIPGIDYLDIKGKKYATSVVDSGRYENKAKGPSVLIYTGQGGNPKITENVADQKLERGNLALVNSMEMGFPVRVIYKRKNLMASKRLDTSSEREFIYVYDGLYTINDYWQEREVEQGGKLVYKFELRRLSDQLKSSKPSVRLGVVNHNGACVLDDVSQGKEMVPIHVVNGKDDDLPQPFTYTTKISYPSWFQQIEPVGCGCTNGCSDSHQCACVLKNAGEIPLNEDGAILRARPRVYECGPSCKCPPNCVNRVTQHGPRHQLEIFKTESRGWGVRSPSFISSGSFICEYVGELLQDKDAEERGANNDEYLFDIFNSDGEVQQGKSEEQGFALDAAVYGNIGRFINHSCSSVNLYAQEVFYDHDDKRMPHIMFFAKKDIPQYQELTYHYNYKIGRVCDANGNTKVKNCYCGSRKCTGRMY